MTRIAFIGAGSTVFFKNLIGDLLTYPELKTPTFTLYDIDPARLHTSQVVTHKVAQATGSQPTVIATTDRDAALDGADFVVTMFQIGGYKPATVIDFEIPKQHGLRQTIADTVGIGGIMRGLRTVPVLTHLADDMARLCPDALMLQHVNPMAICQWALTRHAPQLRTVGLCHSVPHTAGELAADLKLPVSELNYVVAGINHLAFFLRLEHHGRDLTPDLQRVITDGRVPNWNRVRYDVFQRFGYFVTESSEHFSEYVPWYIKRDRPDLIEQFNIPLDEYITRCEAQNNAWEYMRAYLEQPDSTVGVDPSGEYAPQIIHSIVTGQPRTVYANVPNHGLISNLPSGCAVEVPCLVDSNGVQPVHIGHIPPQLSALMQTNINMQSLTVEAALTHRRDHIYHAALLDPHTAAELDPAQITALVDDLLAAHAHHDYQPTFH